MEVEERAPGEVRLPEPVAAVYRQQEAAKFLATASRGGKINVALIVSQIPVEPSKLVFGEFMMVKTKSNLDENPRVASLTVTPKLEMAGLKGEVEEWVQSGPYIDRINQIDFFRYNAYAGIHNAAVMSVRKIIAVPGKISFLTAGLDFLAINTLGRLRGSRVKGGVETPKAVRRKFDNAMAVKVLAYMDYDGYPGIAPVLATFFKDPGELRFKLSSYNRYLSELEPPCKVALNVVTMDLITYQVKGELIGWEKTIGVETGVVRIEEVYSCIPPLVGERVA